MARIQRGALFRAVRRVEFPFGTDLQQQFAVTRILLSYRIGIAAYPQIALVIEVAVVNTAGDHLRISPEMTTLPSGSNSITGGAGLPTSFSWAVRLFGSAVGFTMNTWSFASTHVPPTFPVTQSFGRGLGQKGST